MLDVLVEFGDVGEHVVHVVFGRPPLQREAAEQGGLEATEEVEVCVAAVGGGVAYPAHQDLGEGEGQDADDGIGGGAGDEPRGYQQEEQ